jgi:hypothetical protein
MDVDEPGRDSWGERLRRARASSGYDDYGEGTRSWAPSGLFYVALVLFMVLIVIALSAGPLYSLVLVLVVVAAAFVPRYMKRDALVNDLFQRTRKITREEEYEADVAQDRRRFAALMRGDLSNAVFKTYFENVRKTVRPSKYIRVQFTPISLQELTSRPAHVWIPQRHDIIQVVRYWSPLFEPRAKDGEQLQRLKGQVEAFLGCETVMREDYIGCYAVFTPVREVSSLSAGDGTTPL